MGRKGTGVEAREKSIRISFTLADGQQRKETLKTDGQPLPPTPANLKYATRLAGEIRDKIRHGTFTYGDYFPASLHATTGQGTTVADQLDLWLKIQTDKAPSTRKGYGVAVEWWKTHLGKKLLRALLHTDILTALATEPAWSGKTRNNKVSVLRQALQLAIRDGAIKSNPVDGIEAASHQRPDPDPFSLDEAEAILADMRKHYDPQIALYFEFKFFTGLRTSESLALRWESIDWRQGHMVVREALVLGENQDRTKTHRTRTVQLNSRALAVLKAMKERTFLLKVGGWVFVDPRTGQQFTDDEPPREMYWRPTLRRIGMRYRSPYETRHSYATIMLMSSVTPAYAAKQMGHSIEMFLRTYSKWIDGGQNAVEMRKIEALLGGDSSQNLPQKNLEAAK